MVPVNRRQAVQWSLSAALTLAMPWRAVLAATDDPRTDYLGKINHFNQTFPNDVFLPATQKQLLKETAARLQRLEMCVGPANFHLLSFDEALKSAREFVNIGHFTPAELEFLESLFHTSATEYGFQGDKPITRLTDVVARRRVVKIPETGNYLFKGQAETVYHRLRQAVGPELLLTSGIRSIVKQYSLFLHKVLATDGNLSMASRSLAPPGYSFHGIGDFDVGQAGYGRLNFTSQFVKSPVFARLKKLGYLQWRYTPDNPYGVRFEPWHIQVGVANSGPPHWPRV
ncbi:MAG: D-alanyl-D-alanine carboxypeptidase family protein [Magnetococcales bacterium]|nr:D-alanyl-D-alanine carboxypeptidase family protein [Magnetococcales bacterium]